ncbi:hypothetical protein SAMN00017405_2186 [Desulfonispora thiosulfatigenes DSM 11270]|uniref:Tetratricopeptide repeat-containing protein n=1 Tax=Desulfonispora thiosulfatigenes DSM 11270 TaxID=656914 RepID=A0A1W1ULD9_DESTI|nr:hypothetical protein [Desulfonispora thiosulfatigenes]SMB81897.1 hypothetical protein SAMN00017405_2186 [Desulfonispora thiosulfatigenes DSM 11270]
MEYILNKEISLGNINFKIKKEGLQINWNKTIEDDDSLAQNTYSPEEQVFEPNSWLAGIVIGAVAIISSPFVGGVVLLSSSYLYYKGCKDPKNVAICLYNKAVKHFAQGKNKETMVLLHEALAYDETNVEAKDFLENLKNAS